ncbi:hypothetical protein M407DRAFT_26678 [Tulasnella calospora MUT 4182]|uniref:Uncharacterized protein n=1 Tax=Tulasnella calospora MUT 4182 TaxID=1051891 RepID=A0A0C3QFA6_9AGAM|nr:hypothetical protein M407DRAFT_26678 [Tulasnella calospora MUT 4182]
MGTATRVCIKEEPLTPSSNPQHLRTLIQQKPPNSISETLGTSPRPSLTNL